VIRLVLRGSMFDCFACELQHEVNASLNLTIAKWLGNMALASASGSRQRQRDLC